MDNFHSGIIIQKQKIWTSPRDGSETLLIDSPGGLLETLPETPPRLSERLSGKRLWDSPGDSLVTRLRHLIAQDISMIFLRSPNCTLAPPPPPPPNTMLRLHAGSGDSRQCVRPRDGCAARLRAQPMLHEQHALSNIVFGGEGGGAHASSTGEQEVHRTWLDNQRKPLGNHYKYVRCVSAS